jgi:hypothetical protein
MTMLIIYLHLSDTYMLVLSLISLPCSLGATTLVRLIFTARNKKNHECISQVINIDDIAIDAIQLQ